jgi:hypothetical protein
VGRLIPLSRRNGEGPGSPTGGRGPPLGAGVPHWGLGGGGTADPTSHPTCQSCRWAMAIRAARAPAVGAGASQTRALSP